MENFINLGLMKNPANWAIIILMWMLATMLLHYLSLHWTGPTSQSKQGN
jgi:hypothetical protein